MDAKDPSSPAQGLPGSARPNQRLREALDKLIRGRYHLVSVEELAVLRATHRQLASLAEISPNQARLREIIGNGLSGHAKAEAEAQTHAPAAEIPAESPPTVIPSDPVAIEEPVEESVSTGGGALCGIAEILEKARKEQVREIGEIPVSMNVRVYRHRGDLNIDGDVPDTLLLVVRQGQLRVEGFMFGHALVSGDIYVRENIQGGWVISQRGSVQAGRILTGSRVIAPTGSVRSEQVQNPALLFSGDSLQVRGNLLGGQAYSPVISVGGTVVGTKVQVLNRLTAGAIEAQGGEVTSILFPSVITSQVYGQTLSDSMLISLSAISRRRFRTEVWRQLVNLTQQDLRRVRQLLLYCLHDPATADLELAAALRNAECLHHNGSILAASAEALMRVVQEAMALGTDAVVTVVGAGVEEASMLTRVVEKETEMLRFPSFQSTCNRLMNECRHFNNNARKVREAVVVKSAIDKHALALERRLRELLSELATAEEERVRRREQLEGKADRCVFENVSDDDLALRVFARVDAAKENPAYEEILKNGLYQHLSDTALRHVQNLQQWERATLDGVPEAEINRDAVGGGVVLYPRGAGAREAAAKRFGAGVTLTLHTLLSGQTDPEGLSGPQIRLRQALETPTVFVAEGGGFIRKPWEGEAK